LPLALAGVAESLFGLRPVLVTLALMAIVGGILTGYLAGSSPLISEKT
jgi:hypothetical protein